LDVLSLAIEIIPAASVFATFEQGVEGYAFEKCLPVKSFYNTPQSKLKRREIEFLRG
jgi:hypothetical protein